MAIKNIKIPRETIMVGDGEITVRGISLSDLMVVVNTYGPQAALAFGRIQKGGSLAEQDVRVMFGSLLAEFPEMLAGLMALAADSHDPESIEIMRTLNVGKQVEVVEAVFFLTFPNEGEIKKLLESLNAILAEVSGALTNVRLPSPTGTGESAAA